MTWIERDVAPAVEDARPRTCEYGVLLAALALLLDAVRLILEVLR